MKTKQIEFNCELSKNKHIKNTPGIINDNEQDKVMFEVDKDEYMQITSIEDELCCKTVLSKENAIKLAKGILDMYL